MWDLLPDPREPWLAIPADSDLEKACIRVSRRRPKRCPHSVSTLIHIGLSDSLCMPEGSVGTAESAVDTNRTGRVSVEG